MQCSAVQPLISSSSEVSLIGNHLPAVPGGMRSPARAAAAFQPLMESAAQGQTKEGWTIPGEGVEGGMYDEYHVDDNALYEKMIETFYKEAE